ncbi:MAG TPA: hypothetical protein VKQ32_29495 [Polyangia bacterium]|nr:hypothetical protein [Polyangia bacterium]
MRAWLALAPVVAACGPIPATTPWVVSPAVIGDCLPAEIAKESCYPQPLLAPPLIVGPGQIQVVTASGLSGEGIFKPGIPVRDQIHFFVDEITRAGHHSVAVGRCPGHIGWSEPIILFQTPSGETGVLCTELGNQAGCVAKDPICEPYDSDYPAEGWHCSGGHSCSTTFVYFGVIDRARHSVDWRWTDEIDAHFDGHSIHVAAFGDGAVAIIYQTIHYPVYLYPAGWLVHLALKNKGFELSDMADLNKGEGALEGLVVADGNLHIIVGRDAWEHQYRKVTIAPDGRTWWNELDLAGPVTEGPLAHACAAAGANHTVTLSLPYSAEGQLAPDTPSRMLTLRFGNAFFPGGGDVYPSARSACAPRVGSGDARRSVASFDKGGPLIVYGFLDDKGRAGGLRVIRDASATRADPRPGNARARPSVEPDDDD